jgi:uncharacterized protein (TIGR02145 family)
LVGPILREADTELPEVETLDVSYARRTAAHLEGSKVFIDTVSHVTYGFCWNTQGFPTIEDNEGSEVAHDLSGADGLFFIAFIYGLTPGTTYYVRAYATNQEGTGYGEERSFTTLQASSSIAFNPDLSYGTVSDIDGNTYKTIEIGTQTWMAENLRTTLYSDAAAIPHVADTDEWKQLTTPAYCWYENNDELYKNLYGACYNWYAVNTGDLCPSGWHVSSDEEWKTLELYLGMPPEQVDSPGARGTSEGLLIKETGTGNWHPDGNINGTNDSGFTGLPGGLRWPYDAGYGNDLYSGEGIVSFWWTSSGGVIDNLALCRQVNHSYPKLLRESRDLKWGFNVRCIKD